MKLNKKITQRQFEEYEDVFNAWIEKHPSGESNYFGAIVRGAVESGWFVNVPDGFDVGDQDPGDVKKWALAVDKFYGDAKKVDPNS